MVSALRYRVYVSGLAARTHSDGGISYCGIGNLCISRLEIKEENASF